ncbi:MAG: hypothetical protein ACI4B4_11810 [Segatella copri]
MDYFTQQDKFVADMVEAYKTGKLAGVFRPYIEWKTGGSIFSKQQAYTMLDAASELLERMFDDPEADAELRSYLEGIDGEISNILPILK